MGSQEEHCDKSLFRDIYEKCVYQIRLYSSYGAFVPILLSNGRNNYSCDFLPSLIWCGIRDLHTVLPDTAAEHYRQHAHISKSKKFNSGWYCGVVFKNEVLDVNSVLDNIILIMWCWLPEKMPESVIPFNAWICNPGTCCKDFR